MAQRFCVTGAGGFIGVHLVRRLKELGHWVRGVDIKKPQWSESEADQFLTMDLRDPCGAVVAMLGADSVFHLAAEMGGMGFISTAHAEIIRDNTLININTIEAARKCNVKQFLFSSSACVYPIHLQGENAEPLKESDAYPADPQMSYGWEKLHMEHLCRYYREASWLNTRVVRFQNCYGPLGAWMSGKEKAPAALCRKIAVAKLSGNPVVEIWGDGSAIRSYMYIDDCIDGLLKIIDSDCSGPLNLGPDMEVSVDELADAIAEAASIEIEKKYIEGPVGVQRRNSDNRLCNEVLNWEPTIPLEIGIRLTYEWIEERVLEFYRKEGHWPI